MVRPTPVVVVMFLLAQGSYAAGANEELEKQVDQLRHQVQTLQEKMHRMQSGDGAQDVSAGDDSQYSAEAASFVDLSPEQQLSIDDEDDAHILSNPWWRNYVQTNVFRSSMIKPQDSWLSRMLLRLTPGPKCPSCGSKLRNRQFKTLTEVRNGKREPACEAFYECNDCSKRFMSRNLLPLRPASTIEWKVVQQGMGQL